MIRVVYEDYTVWKLLEDLREGFDPDGYVTITIESIDGGSQGISPDGDQDLPEPTRRPSRELLI